jgi:peptidoglycan/LPS O-acetylase OafA/YrhL
MPEASPQTATAVPLVAPVPDALTPPEGNPRFPALDGLRAVAAISVVAFHADQFVRAQNTVVGRVFSHLDVGVAVFFVITGFLLYRPFMASALGDVPPTPTSLFYRRRVLRILPGYWVALIVLAPLIAYARPFGLPNFFFIQIYRPAWARSGIPPGWSVCVEISFYLLLPFFALLMKKLWGSASRKTQRRRQLILLAVMALASLLVRELAKHVIKSPYAVDPLPGTFCWFAFGMAIAILSVEPGFTKRSVVTAIADHPLTCWLLAGLIYASTLTTAQDVDLANVTIFIRYGLIAALAISPLVFSDVTRFQGAKILQARAMAWLGLISYGIYLYHYPIMANIHISAGSETLDLCCLAVVGGVIAIACGAASYYFIERPMLRFKRTRVSTHRKVVDLRRKYDDEPTTTRPLGPKPSDLVHKSEPPAARS